MGAVGDLSYLPPGYTFVPDPQPAAMLAAPNAAAPAPAAGRGRSRPAAQAAAGGGRGSKRKAAPAQQAEGQPEGDAAPHPKRARAAGGKPRSKGRGQGKAAAAAGSDDEGWEDSGRPVCKGRKGVCVSGDGGVEGHDLITPTLWLGERMLVTAVASWCWIRPSSHQHGN